MIWFYCKGSALMIASILDTEHLLPCSTIAFDMSKCLEDIKLPGRILSQAPECTSTELSCIVLLFFLPLFKHKLNLALQGLPVRVDLDSSDEQNSGLVNLPEQYQNHRPGILIDG